VGPILAALCILLGLCLGILFTAVLIFRFACRWCELEQPGFLATCGIVILAWIVWAIFEGILIAILQTLYHNAGYPPWEARIVGFFVGLPCHLVVTTLLHVGLLRVSFGKAIEVWFIQHIILFSIILVIVGLVGVAVLARNG
jgi:hypothetical protein